MNRENKCKQYQKGYYKTHACDDSFTCRVCGHPVVPVGGGRDHRNQGPTCLPRRLVTMSRATVPPTAAALWTPSVSGSAKTVSGQ